ncbi:MAG TPA: FAD-dependent thymidylate synthase [Pseudomonadales bacterium]|nr:FAD-dependent thymidylate synthase [Pseudomonadales bacterium]
MKVSLVKDRGDLLIASAARASFNRSADMYSEEQNQKLISFLVNASPQHWAPLAHVRLTLRLEHWMVIYKKLNAYNKAGMIEVRQHNGVVDVSHSLWGWYIMLRDRKVHFSIVDSVIDHLQVIAPVASKVLELDKYRARDMHEKGYVQVHQAPVSYETDFVTLRVTCPIVIARQLFKHSVGFVYSEASGRYIEYDKIYKPTEFHSKPASRKQGSGAPLGTLRKAIAGAVMSVSHAVSYASYIALHKWLGVAVEEARYTMPLSTATTFVVTAARADWQRVLDHRLSKDAQTDIQVLAGLIADELNK